jgi:uncharacterized membrane protein
MDVTGNKGGTEQLPEQLPEQLHYATLLERGAWLGMAMLVITFTIYAFGLMPAEIAPAQWPSLWDKPVRTYIELTGAPTGWGWLSRLAKSDYASLSGVAVLAGCSMLSVLALIPMYWKRRDRAFALIATLQVLVLLLAASGMLRAGH